jgi:hypothetical protein
VDVVIGILVAVVVVAWLSQRWRRADPTASMRPEVRPLMRFGGAVTAVSVAFLVVLWLLSR